MTRTTSIHPLAALLLACLASIMNSHAASPAVLFDFQSTGKSTPWNVINDDVMGGVSTSRFQVVPERAAVFSGVVSLENNGGFASVRSGPVEKDLPGLDSFRIRVRGDGRRYKFNVRTEGGLNKPMYQSTFKTGKNGEWEEHVLPFKDFIPTFRGRVLSGLPPLRPANPFWIGFLIADKQDGPFRLEIESVKAVASAP